jgi:hypothetical protein
VSLLVKAHCSRALDLSQARRYDEKWALRRDIVLNQLELDNLQQLKTLRHAMHCGGIARGTAEAYAHHFEKASEELQAIGKLMFPYANWGMTEADSKYKSMWENWFGIKIGSKEWQEMEARGELMRQWLRNRET